MTDNTAVLGPDEPANARDHNEDDPIFRLAASDGLFCRTYNIKTWRRLGGGATACVARIFSRLRHEYVAVKIFVQPRREIQGTIAAEVRVADKVVSANVVRIFGPHEGDAFMWIEMEYVEGMSLKAYLDELRTSGRRVPIQDAIQIAQELTRGVLALHAAGVVHRDIKPENILLPASGTPRVKIADFGIARFREEQRATQTSEWRGTPTYSAPETFMTPSGDSASTLPPLTPEADVYSLGVALFRVMTGAFIYPIRDEQDTYEIVAAHLHGHPRRARALNPDVPEDVEQALLQLVARDPVERPHLGRVLEIWDRHASSTARVSVPPNIVPAVTDAPASARHADAGPAPASPWRPGKPVRPAIAGLAALAIAGAFFFRSSRGSVAETSDRQPTRPPMSESPLVSMPLQAPSATEPAVTASPSVARWVAAAAVETPAPPPAVDLDVRPDCVMLNNKGTHRLSHLILSLVADDGSRYRFSDADALDPDAGLIVPFASFEPEVPADKHLRQLDVTFGSGRKPQDRLSRRLD